MATPDDAAYRLAEVFQAQFDAIDSALARQATAIWMSAGDWRSDSPQLEAAVERIAALLGVSQQRVSSIEVALFDAVDRVNRRPSRQRGQVESVTTDSKDYISGAANKLYVALANKSSFRDALFESQNELRRRLRGQLTDQRYATIRSLNDGGEYRRVLGASSCAFCRTVVGDGSQVYRVAPAPLHPLCNCGIVPA